MRLMDQSTVDNWQMGRLEVFFEGSWSQVCARKFDGPDGNVACRQLGFGAGTVGPTDANGAQQQTETTLVFPEVAITAPGCNGTESNLLECGPEPGRLSTFETRDCFDSGNPGLLIACVAEPLDGTLPVPHNLRHSAVELPQQEWELAGARIGACKLEFTPLLPNKEDIVGPQDATRCHSVRTFCRYKPKRLILQSMSRKASPPEDSWQPLLPTLGAGAAMKTLHVVTKE